MSGEKSAETGTPAEPGTPVQPETGRRARFGERMRGLLPKRRSSALDTGIRRRDRFSARDLVSEAAHGIGARPARLVLTTAGTVLGIASLVITVGLAQTAAGQIGKQFDAVAATQVTIEPTEARGPTGESRAVASLPWDSEDRVSRLAGVEDAGSIAPVNIGSERVSSVDVIDPSAPSQSAPTVLATSAGLLDAVRGTVVTGRYFDAGHDTRGDRVVVLGERAAERLGINRVDSQPSVFIGSVPYTVIGIIGAVERRPDLLDSLVLPLGTARADFGLTSPTEVQVHIDVGAGPVVARQAPIALAPDTPDAFSVTAPRQGSDLQASVQADVNVIFLILGGIALLAGGLGIANITLLSVMERVGEIGLRRALGATNGAIAGQFVVESVVIGLLGGLVGSAAGVFVVLGVSLAQQWTPILDPLVSIGAALLGGVVGLIAGTYPALKAAKIEPIAALRGGI